MNIFYKAYCRIYQFCFKLALPLLPYRKPIILDSEEEIIEVLKKIFFIYFTNQLFRC